jgi:hypothetical protein
LRENFFTLSRDSQALPSKTPSPESVPAKIFPPYEAIDSILLEGRPSSTLYTRITRPVGETFATPPFAVPTQMFSSSADTVVTRSEGRPDALLTLIIETFAA